MTLSSEEVAIAPTTEVERTAPALKWDPVAIAMRPSKRARRPGRISLWLAIGWIALVVVVAVFADALPLQRYDTFTTLPPLTPPGMRLPEFLGTDSTGRSVLSRLIYGARQSLLVGIIAIGIAAVVGAVIGLVAGYFGRAVDAATGVMLDALLAFPPLVLLLAIASVGKRDMKTVIAGLAVLGIASFARLVRANTLAVRNREFVDAARVMGASHFRIMFREILPNVVPAVVSIVFLFMAAVIVAEGSLSFLGLGIPPPSPSWGGMVNEGRQWLSSSPQLVLIPSLCLVFTVLSARRIGEHVRVVLSPSHAPPAEAAPA